MMGMLGSTSTTIPIFRPSASFELEKTSCTFFKFENPVTSVGHKSTATGTHFGFFVALQSIFPLIIEVFLHVHV